MLKEAEIRTFIEGTTNYFEVSAQQAASVGSPYWSPTASRAPTSTPASSAFPARARESSTSLRARGMLMVLLMRMQETDSSEETIKDLVGEVANTISGNARRDFGKNFVISVPTVIANEPDKVVAPHSRSYVIPINWRTHSAKLVVCLE